jgi:hypothetical protein
LYRVRHLAGITFGSTAIALAVLAYLGIWRLSSVRSSAGAGEGGIDVPIDMTCVPRLRRIGSLDIGVDGWPVLVNRRDLVTCPADDTIQSPLQCHTQLE